MARWDLNTGVANLEDALATLKAAQLEAMGKWDDIASHKFDETYLKPLEPRIRRTLDVIHRLADVLLRAERACADE